MIFRKQIELNKEESSYWNEIYKADVEYTDKIFKNWLQINDKKKCLLSALQGRHSSDGLCYRSTALRFLLVSDLSGIFSYSENGRTIDIDIVMIVLELASVGHNDIELCRNVIKMIPNYWLRDNLINLMEPILNNGDEEEYMRLAELCCDIDIDLLKYILKKSKESDNADILEISRYFDDFLLSSEKK
jgi:hypothetical protein